MSGKNCIRKTNDEIFGGFGRLIKRTTTSKGRRGFLFGASVMVVVGGEIAFGMTSAINYAETGGGGAGFAGILVATVVVAITTMIYTITLYDNCTSDNG